MPFLTSVDIELGIPRSVCLDPLHHAQASHTSPVKGPSAELHRTSADATSPALMQGMGPSSPGMRGTPDLKSRWAAISSRARETLSKTQKEWKTLWGRPADMGHSPAHAGPSSSTPHASLAERAGT